MRRTQCRSLLKSENGSPKTASDEASAQEEQYVRHRFSGGGSTPMSTDGLVGKKAKYVEKEILGMLGGV